MKPIRVLALAAVMTLDAAGTGTAGVSGPAPYRYCREIQVAAPGWMRVRLTASMLARMGTSADDYLLADPSGVPLPAFPWVEPPAPPPSLRSAELKDMETVEGGWRVGADLGPGTPLHRMLLVELPGTGLAEGVTLDGSTDGSTWHNLARGSMFRLSRWGLTSKTTLEYAPTRDRYLRLFWPENAGFPTWRALWVADWPEGRSDAAEDPLDFSPAWNGEKEVAYRVSGPRSPLEQGSLLLKMPLPYPVRARLLAGRDGAWFTLSETVCLPDRLALLPIPPGAFSGPAVLALSAGEFPAPPLSGLTLRTLPHALLFKAERAGTYAFCYGASGRAAPRGVLSRLPSMPPSWGEGAWGPERETPLPALPAPSLAMGAALPDADFEKRWPLQPDGHAKVGDLVTLEVPQDAYGVARPDLGDLRIGSGGRQVPYVLWSPPEGIPAAVVRGLTPVPVPGKGTSLLELDLPAPRLPLTSLDLVAPAAPFTRGISLQAPFRSIEGRPGRGEGWSPLDQGTWRCPGAGDLPSRFTLRAAQVEGKRLRLVFSDGDNAPLSPVDATLWRRRHLLIFPWPGGGVDLFAGAPLLLPPTYDLAALKDDMVGRPSPLVKADPAQPGSTSGPFSGGGLSSRWVLLAALGAAVILMVAILARSLRNRPPPDG